MNPLHYAAQSYATVLFGAIPGARLQTYAADARAHNGDLRATMSTWSQSDEFNSTLPPGASDRDIATMVVNRVISGYATADAKASAVEFLLQHKAAGDWGTAIYEGVNALLDAAQDPTWAIAAHRLETKMQYAAQASETMLGSYPGKSGWAKDISDFATLQDLYALGGSEMYAPVNVRFIPRAEDHAGSETYTLTDFDISNGFLAGAGDDVITVPERWYDMDVSGGAGEDTLIILASELGPYSVQNMMPAFTGGTRAAGFEHLVVRSGGVDVAVYDYDPIAQAFVEVVGVTADAPPIV